MNAGTAELTYRFKNLRQGLRALICLTSFAIVMTLQPCRASERQDEDQKMTPAVPATVDRHTSYTSTATAAGRSHVTANFRSFSGDPLSIGFVLDAEAGEASMREFGVSIEELDTLKRTCIAAGGCDQDEFNRHTARYYREHALRTKRAAGEPPRLFVDVAQVVQRNRARVRPVAAALRKLAAERGHGQEWMVEAAMALVQTGLRYKQPSTWDGGRRIMGFFPPPRALERGYGDCDTKAALLAAILLNLTESRVIGVHVPQHYLLGIAKAPREDEAFVTYAGEHYVLVEAAGPGRRQPGNIAHSTRVALERREDVRVDPMF